MDNNQKELVNIFNRRLAEPAKFWYQCIDEYNDLNEFLSSLNALIQSLRNVTFVIQKQKDKIPNFEDWYFQKQDIMKNDRLMKWLVEARNQVVKEGDLKPNSVVVATVKNWLEYGLFTLNVDPLTNNDKIIELVLSKLKRKEIVQNLREPLLQIERTWRVDQFPDKEILEILSHCYRLLKSIVYDLYLQIGIEKPTSIEYIEKDNSLLQGLVSNKAKTTYIDLKDCSIIQHVVNSHPFNAKIFVEAAKRYNGDKIDFGPDPGDVNDPFSYLNVYLEISKTILKKDGFHAPMVHYFYRDKDPTYCIIPVKDKTEFYYLIRQVAEDIIKQSVTGLIFILEQWIYPLDKNTNRGECLMVACINNDGKFESYTVPFSKEKGHIIIEPTILDFELKNQNWLRPIVQAWNIELK